MKRNISSRVACPVGVAGETGNCCNNSYPSPTDHLAAVLNRWWAWTGNCVPIYLFPVLSGWRWSLCARGRVGWKLLVAILVDRGHYPFRVRPISTRGGEIVSIGHNLQQRAPAVPLFLKIHHTGGDKTEGIIGIDCAVVVQHRMHLACPFGQAAISWGSVCSGCLSQLLRMCFISLAVYFYTVMGMAPGEFET